jgi:uncharacterized membrane protein YbhN (UPF0104 family)
MQSFSSPVFRVLSWLIKIAIVIAAAFYIYQKVFHRNDSEDFRQRLQLSWHAHATLFIAAFLLLFVNWGTEAFKWQLLLRKLSPITFIHAFRSILAGVTTGVFTPNRAGEFGGRIICLDEGHRVEAALLSVAGGLLQLSVTLLTALPAIFLANTSAVVARNHFLSTWFILLIVFGVLLSMWIFRRRIAPWALPYLRLFPAYPWRFWLQIFILSVIRYCVFSAQFHLLLEGFGIELSAEQAYPAIALTFFASTVIPTFALSEIGVRGSVSVLFIGLYTSDAAGILAASFLLWIINIALPALAGSVFVMRSHLFTQTADE